ncbi:MULTISPECIES: DUF6118 family protein [Agrobacterium]|uniref:DUF6118 family protein n=2 Tax=Rhizobium/Agrobacterium group TaxID=227290 RepID=UPI001CD82E20|nr:DUF6118 family protein [Agrobacterium sp. MS2]
MPPDNRDPFEHSVEELEGARLPERQTGVVSHETGEDDVDAGDPAAAFEALRETVESLAGDLTREMTTIRRGVETALDQFERQGAPIDYSADLSQLTQGLVLVTERLHAVEQLPLLRQSAEHQARILERTSEGLVRDAVKALERQALDLERISTVLASRNAQAFHRKDQDFRMWVAAVTGVIVGAFLLVALPRFLPFSADTHVAALVMGKNRIDAGSDMISSVDPFTLQKMSWGARFYDAGGEAVAKCLAKAEKMRKDQKCTVTVPAPETQQ